VPMQVWRSASRPPHDPSAAQPIGRADQTKQTIQGKVKNA